MFEEYEVIEPCKSAYLKTLEKDKTINIEAFVDNLTQELLSIQKL